MIRVDGGFCRVICVLVFSGIIGNWLLVFWDTRLLRCFLDFHQDIADYWLLVIGYSLFFWIGTSLSGENEYWLLVTGYLRFFGIVQVLLG